MLVVLRAYEGESKEIMAVIDRDERFYWSLFSEMDCRQSFCDVPFFDFAVFRGLLSTSISVSNPSSILFCEISKIAYRRP